MDISTRIINVDVIGIFAKSVIDVHHLSVAHIRTILLERDTKDEYLGILYNHISPLGLRSRRVG